MNPEACRAGCGICSEEKRVRNLARKAGLAGVALVISIGTSGIAGAANMKLTGAGNNVLDGVFIGPYTVTIDGKPTLVICDDFADDTYMNETWGANMSTVSNLGNVKWKTPPSGYTEQQAYNEAAYLSEQL